MFLTQRLNRNRLESPQNIARATLLKEQLISKMTKAKTPINQTIPFKISHLIVRCSTRIVMPPSPFGMDQNHILPMVSFTHLLFSTDLGKIQIIMISPFSQKKNQNRNPCPFPPCKVNQVKISTAPPLFMYKTP